MKKIIHIMGGNYTSRYYTDSDKPVIDDPFITLNTEFPPYRLHYHTGHHHVRVALKISEISSEYKHECWHPEILADRIYQKNIQGLKFKLFPMKPPKTIKLKKNHIISKAFSRDLINELKKEVKKGNVLVHLHGFPGGHNELILKHMSLDSIPLIVQHRGGSFKFEKYGLMNNNFKNKILSYLHRFYTYNIGKKYYRDVDYFFSNTKAEYQTLKKLGFENIKLHKDGVDFNSFNILDKKKAREKLDLPVDKKTVIYIGRFYKEKGVDKIIDAFNNLKSSIDINLILVGGSKSDDLYQAALDSGAKVVPRVPNSELVKYIQAADLSVAIYSNYIVKFGGFGRSTLEAFACGVPFISQNLIHFIGSKKELKELGIIPQSLKIDELESCIKEILNNPECYLKCRETAKKYYDFDVTVKQNLSVYSHCFKQYSN